MAAKTWDEAERHRKWKNSTVNWTPDALITCKGTDRRVTERVVDSRNEHYMGMIRETKVPNWKDSLVRVRSIPKELHAWNGVQANKFYWGA
jgi:hypothetical protein